MIWRAVKARIKGFWNWLKRKLAGVLESDSDAAKKREEQSENGK